jgi:arginyl-tRNA synthetase
VAGALRYQFLKIRVGSDVVFDINEAVSLHGNSGSYLQYAHARACSILGKASVAPKELSGISLEEAERPLVRKLSEYAEVATRAQEGLLPHYICTYLYELAQEFNRFYEKNKVVGSGREAERVALVGSYAATLKSGLELLGIHAPEKM